MTLDKCKIIFFIFKNSGICNLVCVPASTKTYTLIHKYMYMKACVCASLASE